MIAVPAEARTQPSAAENELLKRFAAGDLGAFESLFRQFQAAVYGWIIRLVRDPGAAEDLTLEAFWRIYRARERFQTERSFGAWARRIATNLAIDHLKTVRPAQSLLADSVRGEEVDQDRQLDVRRQTERAFRQLPARYQVVATLALVEERPYEEIAQTLGISVGAVKSRIFRAVRLLRKKLQRLGVE
jgi:RNA polymerase sigma-70 factor (ECF subfamily)